jgi:hypothetical protein
MDKDITSIDFFDDDKDYEETCKLLQEATAERKRVLIKEMMESSEKLIAEIDRKTTRKEALKKTQIDFILKKSKKNRDSIEELQELDFQEVKEIYDRTLYENKSFVKKFFAFLFNLS